MASIEYGKYRMWQVLDMDGIEYDKYWIWQVLDMPGIEKRERNVILYLAY